MNNKNLNQIAAIEKAIKEKYGDDAIANPRAFWDEDKEKEYLQQMKEFYAKTSKNSEWEDKIDVNGIKVSKKLLNKEPRKNCPVCGKFPKTSMDDVCLVKFECCNNCYIKYVEDREERWKNGWRPNLKKDN
jgi:formate dehydrogenase maturation protein FdhE|tara:strand:- start:18202 stop:18594 length:393 start_codon:yes stop_codon:yes gene_type:complete